ncbi:hypothetical protein GGR51DRAFT_372800 [Nemania sp. FL0031]|nr:hypothetical protein GGR51DRAFT_372800 [Nemania sp. FL0031]
MVFCAYCGKGFTRKEHLERHLPRHTNVKPHRCTECSLSFSRKDLLQRHYNTYHQERDPMDRAPEGANTTVGHGGRIACAHCAQAKTACDKLCPQCTRCRQKNLQCEVRYARRAQRGAIRAASNLKSRGSVSTPMPATLPPVTGLTSTVAPALIHPDLQVKTPVSPQDVVLTIDPLISQHDNSKKASPANSHLNFPNFNTPPMTFDNVEFFNYGDLSQQDSGYSNLMFPELIDYGLQQQGQAQADPNFPHFTEFSPMSGSNMDNLASSRASTHTRSTSIMSTQEYESVIIHAEPTNQQDDRIPEHEAVTAGDRAWPLARCNPVSYSGSCPRTAMIHLESLEQKSKRASTWDALIPFLDGAEQNNAGLTSVIPMNQRTRDHMVAITQTFLQKALNIHHYSIHEQSKHSTNSGLLTFLDLPPSNLLNYFLESYVRNLSIYYSLVATSRLDPNEMIEHNNTATLLILLMIAQGASAVPREGARSLSTGLIETCRISLFDIIEKNVEMCADSTVHRCALLFTLLGAWSGDKWLMDIAMGQRGMYLEMLKHAGMFESQPSTVLSIEPSINIELEWHSWVERETKNRLVYNWVMVDQEISLFHDTAPLLAISNLCAPLPGPEELWVSENASQWMAAMQSAFNSPAIVGAQLLTSQLQTPSLYDLYQQFTHDNVEGEQTNITPYRLRLLLHPLQALLWHLQEMTCYSSVTPNMTATVSTPANKPPLISRQEEVQKLLQKWHQLASVYLISNPACMTSMTNLILFHLISLNSVTNFPSIERLARRQDSLEQGIQTICYIYHTGEAIYHCGQVIRLVRAMPTDRRPAWWSAAVYRAMLILWAYSVLPREPNVHPNPESELTILIDHVTLEAESLYEYMWLDKGTPVLSGPNGSTVSISSSSHVIDYAVGLLDGGVSTRFGDGIRRKLMALKQRWSG